MSDDDVADEIPPGHARVTVSFLTDHPLAMVTDWPRMLGLLDASKFPVTHVKRVDVDVQAGNPEPRIGGDL